MARVKQTACRITNSDASSSHDDSEGYIDIEGMSSEEQSSSESKSTSDEVVVNAPNARRRQERGTYSESSGNTNSGSSARGNSGEDEGMAAAMFDEREQVDLGDPGVPASDTTLSVGGKESGDADADAASGGTEIPEHEVSEGGTVATKPTTGASHRNKAPTEKTFYMGDSTLSQSSLDNLIEGGYLEKDKCRLPEATETTMAPRPDEAVVFQEFFVAGLLIPCHPFVLDVLRRYRLELHELSPSGVVHLAKFLWAIESFGGRADVDVFTKYFALHYKLHRIVCEGKLCASNCGVYSFKPRSKLKTKLAHTSHNKWSSKWHRCWF